MFSDLLQCKHHFSAAWPLNDNVHHKDEIVQNNVQSSKISNIESNNIENKKSKDEVSDSKLKIPENISNIETNLNNKLKISSAKMKFKISMNLNTNIHASTNDESLFNKN